MITSSNSSNSSNINNNSNNNNSNSNNNNRLTIGGLVYHHPLKITERNLLKFKIPLNILNVNPSNATNYRFSSSVPCCNPKKERKVVTKVVAIAFVTTFYMLRIWLQHYKFSSWTKTSCQQQQQTEWGPSEVFSCLIKCGADSNLIDEQWVENHYKWIVWKITSMVRLILICFMTG